MQGMEVLIEDNSGAGRIDGACTEHTQAVKDRIDKVRPNEGCRQGPFAISIPRVSLMTHP